MKTANNITPIVFSYISNKLDIETGNGVLLFKGSMKNGGC